jgi:hypothetical protein
MNEEIGAEAALFPEKEYINGIAFAVLFLRVPWVNQQLASSDFTFRKR